MRIVIAECSAIYTGRGDTKLDVAVRAIMIKTDGSVSLHSDQNMKPLNYMTGKVVFTEEINPDGGIEWVFDSSRESLRLTLYSIISDSSHELSEFEPGLQRDGTEKDLKFWLASNPSVLGSGYSTVDVEYPTGQGPVDLYVLDELGVPVAVEIKRVATLASVGQILRYVHSLREISNPETRGMIAALDIRPKTKILADKHEFLRCVTLPDDWR